MDFAELRNIFQIAFLYNTKAWLHRVPHGFNNVKYILIQKNLMVMPLSRKWPFWKIISGVSRKLKKHLKKRELAQFFPRANFVFLSILHSRQVSWNSCFRCWFLSEGNWVNWRKLAKLLERFRETYEYILICFKTRNKLLTSYLQFLQQFKLVCWN